MTTGTVTGYRIGKNRNGTKNVVLLQVRITDQDDIQTVELRTPPGDDSVPSVGSNVVIVQSGSAWKIGVAVSDDIDPEMGEGEKKLYSQAAGTVQAFIKLLNTGIVEINGNTDFAVRFKALDAALQGLVTAINARFATKQDATGTPGNLTLNLSAAKVNEVKLP